MTLINAADAVYLGSDTADKVYLGTVQVWPMEVGFEGSGMIMGLFPITVTGNGVRQAEAGGAMTNL